jgi:hypothetical protein
MGELKMKSLLKTLTLLAFAASAPLALAADSELLLPELPSPSTGPEATDLAICSGFSMTGVANNSSWGSFAYYDDSTPSCSGPRYTAGHSVCIEAIPAAGHGLEDYAWSGAYCPCNGSGYPGAPLYFCCFTMPSSIVRCNVAFN